MQENILDNDILTLPKLKECECGRCGEMIETKDKYGRPKKFVVGHNRRGKRLRDPLTVEIDKIKTLEQAKHILREVVKTGHEKDAYISELEDRLTTRQYTEHTQQI